MPTTLSWDPIGERFYESGIDRGVLYLPGGSAVPWNGITAITEKVSGSQVSENYFDGVKYSIQTNPGEYAGTLKAYTYPDEFLQFEGTQGAGNGLFVTNQPAPRFNLSYRTMIGNDEDGASGHYKIHVLYNLTAAASQKNYQSWSATTAPMEFEWNIEAIPGEVANFRPTAHLIFDTRQMGPLLLKDIESTLYGDGITEARLPPISTLVSFVGDWVIIRITDNLDGTWTAEGPDDLVHMVSATEFEILQANATYIDANTFFVSNKTY